jgi:hypothetical protein
MENEDVVAAGCELLHGCKFGDAAFAAAPGEDGATRSVPMT